MTCYHCLRLLTTHCGWARIDGRHRPVCPSGEGCRANEPVTPAAS